MDSNQLKITDKERGIRIDLIIHMKKQKEAEKAPSIFIISCIILIIN